MTFDRVQYNGRALILHLPLTLTPHLDQESGQLYVATDKRLGVHVFAQTREQLAEELVEQLLFLWEAYALEDPARLTESRGSYGMNCGTGSSPARVSMPSANWPPAGRSVDVSI